MQAVGVKSRHVYANGTCKADVNRQLIELYRGHKPNGHAYMQIYPEPLEFVKDGFTVDIDVSLAKGFHQAEGLAYQNNGGQK